MHTTPPGAAAPSSTPDDDRLWNADYLKVLAANFSYGFAFYLVTPLLPLYLSETFATPKDIIGLALSGYAVTAILARPVAGWLVDSLPRKRVLLTCVFFYFIFFGGYLLAATLAFFVVVRTLHGISVGALTVANSTAVIDVLPPSRRSEGIGYYGVSLNIATAIAPTVGMYIHNNLHDYNVLFLVALAAAGLGLVSVAGVRMRLPQQRRSEHNERWLERLVLLRGLPIGCNMIVFGFCFSLLANYLALYDKEVLGINDGTGLFFLLLAVGLILSRLHGGKALRNGHFVANAGQGLVLSTMGYTLFIAWPTEMSCYVSAFLIGLGNGHIWPAFQNMILGVARAHEHGTAMSTLLTSWSLGLCLGILGGGVLTEHLGYTVAFWVVAWVHIAGAAQFFLVTRGFYLRHKLD